MESAPPAADLLVATTSSQGGNVSLQQGTLSVQHNGTAVGTRATLDFEDASGFVWTTTDDTANARVKVTPPVLTYATNVADGGNRQDTGTFTITAPRAGTFCLEFGAGFIDTVTTGTQLKLSSNLGGEADYSDTSGGGGSALVAGQVLTNGQVITITCTKTSGSALGTLKGCWAKLTQTA